MSNQIKVEFTCSECGGHKLGYQKYIRWTVPVTIQKNGHVQYYEPEVDENDSADDEKGFYCVGCGELVTHCWHRMVTEEDLLFYLNMSPEEREEQERQFGEAFERDF